MDKASFFILNIFLNSILAFFTAVFLIEGIIFLFRVKQGRMAAILRMIPIFKLPVDLFLYDFSRWAYAQGISPFNCEEGTRSLSVILGWMTTITDWLFVPFTSGIQMTLPGNVTFTVADVMGYLMKPVFLKTFALLFPLVTLVLLIRKCFLYYRSINSLDSLGKTSQPLSRKIRNSALISWFKKHPLRIATTSALKSSPFVAGLTSPIIYIPNHLAQELSRKEFEAVLAHEIEHVRHKDSWVRLILDLIESIFWWVPTKWLHVRIEDGQEVGCDHKCKNYGIDPLDLASAIAKSARHSINRCPQILVHHLTKQTIHKRVNLLLQSRAIRLRLIRSVFSLLALGIAFLLIFLGRFWTF